METSMNVHFAFLENLVKICDTFEGNPACVTMLAGNAEGGREVFTCRSTQLCHQSIREQEWKSFLACTLEKPDRTVCVCVYYTRTRKSDILLVCGLTAVSGAVWGLGPGFGGQYTDLPVPVGNVLELMDEPLIVLTKVEGQGGVCVWVAAHLYQLLSRRVKIRNCSVVCQREVIVLQLTVWQSEVLMTPLRCVCVRQTSGN